jgi:protein-disulfide isomerase
MTDAGKNRRDRAAQAQQAANASEKKRERTVRIAGAVTVLVVVVGIIGVAVFAKNQSTTTTVDSSAITASADPAAPVPTGVQTSSDTYAYGVPYKALAADVPVLEIWEDFQCPACQAVEKANGTGIESLADQGKVNLVWRPTTFLDRNLGNDASARALAAWGCAVDAGKSHEYHNTVYANPPANEGDGFTDDQLIAFATTAGITGADLDTFTTCFTDRTYLPWAANSTKVFLDSNISGTPFALLNGVEVPTATLVDQVALEKLVSDTAAGKAPSAAPSAAASAAASPAAS